MEPFELQFLLDANRDKIPGSFEAIKGAIIHIAKRYGIEMKDEKALPRRFRGIKSGAKRKGKQ